jgi:large subunit ribosomal protein L25
VDVSGLDIGDSVHVEDIDLPEGIVSLEDEHLTVATVAAPTVPEEPEEEVIEEELAEGEEAKPEQEDEGTEESQT